MAHIGRYGPVAWCRDLSHPPFETIGYLPLRLGLTRLIWAGEGVLIDLTDEGMSDEATYDYNDGFVSYRWELTQSGNTVEIVSRHYAEPDGTPFWFRSEWDVAVNGGIAIAFETEGDCWVHTGYPDINHFHDDPDTDEQYALLLTSFFCPWSMLPV